MKFLIKILCLLLCINLSLNELFCPKTKEPPQEIETNPSFTINPITDSGQEYRIIKIANKFFLDKSTGKSISRTSGFYTDSSYCPGEGDFIIPKKEDYESVISQLGSNAYSTFTDPNGFNMEVKNYYLTNTKGSKQYSKLFMYLDGTNIKFIDAEPNDINKDSTKKAVCRCMLDLSKNNIIFPNNNGIFKLNQPTQIETSKEKYINGVLWKIEGSIYKSDSISVEFKKSGMHMIEFWGNYINGESVYLCENIFVEKKSISNTQDFGDSSIKVIPTTFDMEYTSKLHFEHSNSPVAPRIDGGYYIAFTDRYKYLHVLSYDKDDNLITDFNTTEKAYPHDIVSTDYGFAIYVIEAGSSYHSYLSVYNKNFELINTVQIMNNSGKDDMSKNSTLKKQIIRYGSDKYPVYGMNFMYKPDNGKLQYSRGIIFLIFAHYNNFPKSGGHTGDTVVTFNDILTDMNFGLNWGSSHSLIQSATFDEFYFWTAALGDAYPQGISVEYTSKDEFSNSYDPINKKYNLRKYAQFKNLAGSIKGYGNGSADGKLGGILYFDQLKLYCLIYAKTPNYSSDDKNNTNIIYITTWKFTNKQISDLITKELIIFESNNNVMQVRAGRYGNDKLFIIYSETTSSGGNGYGSISKGTKPKLSIFQLPEITQITITSSYDDLLMNTNEDLRTFEDGVLIWATSNKQGKLTINKIGTPRLKEDDNDIDYELTNEDLIDYLSNHEEITDNNLNEANVEEEESGDLSGGAVAGIVIGSIGGAGGIGVGVYFLLKFFKNRNLAQETIPQTKVNSTRFSNSNNLVNSRNNVNSKSSVNNNSTIRNLGKGKRKVIKKRKSMNK